jgi:hypothetical protein
MEGIASALVHFHERGYVHRDIAVQRRLRSDGVADHRPWDFLGRDGPSPREKDFIMGTVHAPSRSLATTRIDHRSDCYSSA